MNVKPLDEAELTKRIAEGVAVMEPPANALWNLIRVQPVKWQLHPWGDCVGGFWVVGVIGRQVVWFNEIEGGFNISRYDDVGAIAEYWCNQDELSHAMYALLRQINGDQVLHKLGPPQALPWIANPRPTAGGQSE